jgi:hypothetical protein
MTHASLFSAELSSSSEEELTQPKSPQEVLNNLCEEVKEESRKSQEDPFQVLRPTPIGKEGLKLVNTVPLSEGLLSSMGDKSYLSSVLEPLASIAGKEDLEKSRDMGTTKLGQLKSEESTDPNTALGPKPREIRPYQSDQWNERYSELVEYRNKKGNVNVPYNWPQNRPLSQWVKRQRHQYKLKAENKHSNLSHKRESLLNSLGFIWDSRAANWEERYQELLAFHREHGHCQVTRKHAENRQLALWLKRQRHTCRLYLSGEPGTGMTPDRITKLVDLGVNLNFKMR